eukprot:TRINITY_DN8502_c0_g1_i1.p1 TRINITY_DN8502_c0_g1~~TRINITY_DN8502_c0_g1_i1.p1  ORF type:complete len:556 (+),score=79.34 TRINITY_DN8502_c0_g1_i1:90-1757(+)
MPTITDLEPMHVIKMEYTFVRLKKTLGIEVKPSESLKEVEYEEGENPDFTRDAVTAVVTSYVKESTLGADHHIMFEMPPDSVGWATGKGGEFLDYCDTELPNCLVIYKTSPTDRDLTKCIILSLNERSRISAALLVKVRIEGTLPGIFTSREVEKSHSTDEIRTRVFNIKNRDMHTRSLGKEFGSIRGIVPSEVVFEMMGPDHDKWFYIWGPNPQRSKTECLIRGAYFGDNAEAQKILSEYADDVTTFSCPEQYNIVQRGSASYNLQNAKRKHRCITFSHLDKQDNKKITVVGKALKNRLATAACIKADIEDYTPGFFSSKLQDQKSSNTGAACDTFTLCEGEKSVLANVIKDVEVASCAAISIVGQVVHIVGDVSERKRARSYIRVALAINRNGEPIDTNGPDLLAVAADPDDRAIRTIKECLGVAVFRTKIDGRASLVIAGSTEENRTSAERAATDRKKLEECEKEHNRFANQFALRDNDAFWRYMAQRKRSNPYDDNRRGGGSYNDRGSRNYQGGGNRNFQSNRSGGGGYNQRGRDSHGPSGGNFTKFQKRY